MSSASRPHRHVWVYPARHGGTWPNGTVRSCHHCFIRQVKTRRGWVALAGRHPQ